MFTSNGFSDNLEAKGIEQLINEFSSNANEFKQSMKGVDFAEKLKINKNTNKPYESTEGFEPYRSVSSTILKDNIKLTNSFKDGRKIGPVKAERIVIKKPMIKTKSHS